MLTTAVERKELKGDTLNKAIKASVDSFIAGAHLGQAIECAEKALGRGQLTNPVDDPQQQSFQSSGQARTSTINPHESDMDRIFRKAADEPRSIIESKVSFIRQMNLIFNIYVYITYLFQMDSSILLDNYLKDSLLFLIGLQNFSFSLLWRGSRDGFRHADFHRLCDGQGRTLTVIKSTDGWIFGGYTSVSWSSDDQETVDDTAFLYTLTNPSRTPLKFKVNDCVNAVDGNHNMGMNACLVFGLGELYVTNESNTNRKSIICLMNYANRYYNEENSGQLFVGNEDGRFQTSEIEVFRVLGTSKIDSICDCSRGK